MDDLNDEQVYGDFGTYPDVIDLRTANLLLQCCLFRLGGEQVFNDEDLVYIQSQVYGMRFKADRKQLVLRLKLKETK